MAWQCGDFRGKTMRAAQIMPFSGNRLLWALILGACRLSQASPYFSMLWSSGWSSLLGCLDEKLGNTEGKVLTCMIHEGGADPVLSPDRHPGIPKRYYVDTLFSHWREIATSVLVSDHEKKKQPKTKNQEPKKETELQWIQWRVPDVSAYTLGDFTPVMVCLVQTCILWLQMPRPHGNSSGLSSSSPAGRHRVAEHTFVACLRAHLPAKKAVLAAQAVPAKYNSWVWQGLPSLGSQIWVYLLFSYLRLVETGIKISKGLCAERKGRLKHRQANRQLKCRILTS